MTLERSHKNAAKEPTGEARMAHLVLIRSTDYSSRSSVKTAHSLLHKRLDVRFQQSKDEDSERVGDLLD